MNLWSNERMIPDAKGISFAGTATTPSIQLLKLARQVLARAGRRQKEALKRNTTVELRELLEVFVLVAASLEAFINEFVFGTIL